MTTFRIDIVADPSGAVAGTKAVASALGTAQNEASKLRESLNQMRPVGLENARDSMLRFSGASQQAAAQIQSTRAALSTPPNTGAVKRAVEDVGRSIDSVNRKANDLGRTLKETFKGVVAGVAAKQIFDLAANYQELQNKLRVVTTSEEDLAKTTARLLDISRASRAEFAAVASLYSRLSLSSAQLGLTQEQLFSFTENLNRAIAVSGATTQEASAGLIQLSQAMGVGVLRGDELRSVMENLPVVGARIARQMGTTTGALKTLGHEGAISAKIIADAFTNADEVVDKQFAATVPTVRQQIVGLGNEILALAGAMDEASDFTRLLGDGFAYVADVAKAAREGMTGFRQVMAETEADQALSRTGQQILSVRREIEFLEKTAKRDATGKIIGPKIQERLDRLRLGLAALRGEARETAAAATAAAAPAEKKPQRTEEQKKNIAKTVQEFQRQNEQILASINGYQNLETAIDAVIRLQEKGIVLTQQEVAGFQFLAQRNAELQKRQELQKGILEPMQDEAEALQLIIAGQEHLTEALRIAQDLRSKGIHLNDQEKQALVALTQRNQALRDQAEAMRTLIGPQQEINRGIAAYNAIIAQTPALAEEAKRKILELQIAGLETSTSLGDGFKRAFLKMKLEANDFAAVGESVVNVFADQAVDAITKFVDTGKFKFKEFASAIVSDLTRIVARLLVVQALSSIFGGGAGFAVGAGAGALSGGRASGGPAHPNRSYLVGESGKPEILTMGDQGGQITPVPAQSAPQPPPQVHLQVVNVTDPDEVPKQIASGQSDEAIINSLARNPDRVKQTLGL